MLNILFLELLRLKIPRKQLLMEIWRKNLYTIWIAQFIAMIGMSMVIPFLPFYVRELGVTGIENVEKWSGLAFAGTFFMAFLMTPIWGALSDRFGKKSMVVRAIFGLALSQILIGLAGDVVQLVIFRMIQGAVSGFIASSLALVTAGTPRERSGYALGILQTSISAGTIIGPVVGGLLSDTFTYSTVFFITSIFCIISGILILINVKEPESSLQQKRFTVLANYKYTFANKRVLLAMLSVMVVQMAIFMAQPIFALYVESFDLETGYLATIAGTLFGITGAFTVISSPWWGNRNDTKGFRKNLMVAMIGAAIAFILHPFIFDVIFLYPVRAFLGFCIGGIVPVFYSYITKHIEEDRKGGIMGIASSFTLLGNLLGPLFCIFLTQFFTNRYVFFFSGLLMLINVIVVYKYLREARPGDLKPVEGIKSDYDGRIIPAPEKINPN